MALLAVTSCLYTKVIALLNKSGLNSSLVEVCLIAIKILLSIQMLLIRFSIAKHKDGSNGMMLEEYQCILFLLDKAKNVRHKFEGNKYPNKTKIVTISS